MDIPEQKSNTFSQQQINNIVALSETLKKVHIRLIHEGYRIADGKIIPPLKQPDAVKYNHGN